MSGTSWKLASNLLLAAGRMLGAQGGASANEQHLLTLADPNGDAQAVVNGASQAEAHLKELNQPINVKVDKATVAEQTRFYTGPMDVDEAVIKLAEQINQTYWDDPGTPSHSCHLMASDSSYSVSFLLISLSCCIHAMYTLHMPASFCNLSLLTFTLSSDQFVSALQSVYNNVIKTCYLAQQGSPICPASSNGLWMPDMEQFPDIVC